RRPTSHTSYTSYSRVSIGFSYTVSEIQNTGQSQRISPRVEFRSVFCAPSRKFKILAILDELAHESRFNRFFVHCLGNSKYWPLPTLDHGKSYEHGFMKKCNGHKLSRSCEQSRVLIGFLCTVMEIQNTDQSQRISPRVEFRSVLRAPSRKFKILAITEVLAHVSSFDWFFMHRLGNSKY
ncbi:hypothetical protein B296_00056668, partial [Ensete ventricosum]